MARFRIHLLRIVLMGFVGIVAPAGCLDHDRAGFDDVDAGARFRAIEAAAENKDRSAIPHLITALLSDDPAERFLAIHSLESLTGQTLGYRHSDPRASRLAAAERWQAWYASQSSPGRAANP